MRLNVMLAIAAAAPCAVFAVAAPSRAETTLERVQKQGFVTMGFMNEAPYDFVQDSTLTGADVEVLRHVLKKMGIPEVNGVVQEFAALIPGLIERRWQAASARSRPAAMAAARSGSPAASPGCSG